MKNKPSDQNVTSAAAPHTPPRPSRHVRLHALLFGGATLATTALLFGGGPIKFPQAAGD